MAPALDPAFALASLRDVHAGWAWVVIIGNGLAGVWALAAHRWQGLRTRALWWFTVFVEVAVFIQVGLGVGLVAGEKLVAPKFHLFYGFVAIISVGLLAVLLTGTVAATVTVRDLVAHQNRALLHERTAEASIGGRPQRVRLCDRPNHRQIRLGPSLCEEGDMDQGYRSGIR